MRNLKRALSLALAAIMVMGLMVVGASAASTYDNFTDKDEIVNQEAVNTMVSLGVLAGKDDGSYFDPTGIVTRGEMAKIVAVCLNGGKEPVLGDSTNIPKFSDVPSTHWAYNYVAYCVQQGIIAGRGDGTFAPDEPVTGSAAAKMFLCALGYRADLEGLTGNEWELNTNVLANQDAKLYEGLEGINASEGLSRDNTAQMAYNAVQANEVTYNNLQGDYAGVIQTDRLDTMLTRRFKVVKVTGILEANDKVSVAGAIGYRDNNNNWVTTGNDLYATALEGKSLLNVTDVTGAANVKYDGLYNAQSFTVDTSDEMVGQEIVLYVRFLNDLAPNASSATVIGEPILTSNNTVVETSARLKDASAVRSALREGGMTNIGNPAAFLYTENDVQPGVNTGITDTISGNLRPNVAVASYNERSAGIFQRFIDNDGNGTPDYIVQIVPVLSSVNSVNADRDTFTFTGIQDSISDADIVTDETLERNDVVLITKYADDCYYVSYPETVEGVVASWNENNSTVSVDGTSYGNSGGKMLNVSGVQQFLTEEETVDGTFIFYLDPAGNVLGYKETEAVIGNYAVVRGWDRTGNPQMGYSATVKLLMQDGTTATYDLNLAASAVNLGLIGAGATTKQKEDAITVPNYVGDPDNVDASGKYNEGTLLWDHLFSYTLNEGTVTLGRPEVMNDNYYSNTAADNHGALDAKVDTLSKNTASYATVGNGTVVANDNTVFFIKDSNGDYYVVTGLSKLPNTVSITGGETIAYQAPGSNTVLAKAIFVTSDKVYQSAREFVFVTDKYVRESVTNPTYTFTVVHPDGTTESMTTKTSETSIKNTIAEYDYTGSYVNFYTAATILNNLYVEDINGNTITLANIQTGKVEASLRVNADAKIWDVQEDEPAADSFSENDMVCVIKDADGAVKAGFIYDVMDSTTFAAAPTGLTVKGGTSANLAANAGEQLAIVVTPANGTTLKSITVTLTNAAGQIANTQSLTLNNNQGTYTVPAALAAGKYTMKVDAVVGAKGLNDYTYTTTFNLTVNAAGTTTATLTGNQTTNAVKTALATANYVQIDGNLTVDAALEIAAGKTVEVNGDVTTSANLTGTGSLVVNGGLTVGTGNAINLTSVKAETLTFSGAASIGAGVTVDVTGTEDVKLADTTTVNGTLNVAGDFYYNGKTLNGSGKVNVSGTTYMGSIMSGTVTVTTTAAVLLDDFTLSGGTLKVTGSITDESKSGTLTVSGGTLEVTANVTGEVAVSGTGTVKVTGSLTGDLTVSGGTAEVGSVTGNVTASAGTTTVNGDISGDMTASDSADVTVDGAVSGEQSNTSSGDVSIGDTKPAPDGTVKTGKLHDTRNESEDPEIKAQAIADADLVGTYTVSATLDSVTGEGTTVTVYNVTLTAAGLKQHQNADTPESMGYWAGISVKAEENQYYSFGWGQYITGTEVTKQITSETLEGEESGYCTFYRNFGASDMQNFFYVAIKDASGNITVYNVDCTGVTKA